MDITYGRQLIFRERRRLKILPIESEKTLQMQKNMGGDYASESKEA